MSDVLFSFVGGADLGAIGKPDEPGAIARLVDDTALLDVTAVHLVDDRRGAAAGRVINEYVPWLRARLAAAGKVDATVTVHEISTEDPTDFDLLYSGLGRVLAAVRIEPGQRRAFNLSSGTPAMSTIMLLLSQSPEYPAAVFQASTQRGVQEVKTALEITHKLRREARAHALSELKLEPDPLLPGFYAEDDVLRRALGSAQWAARAGLSVLINGESGTGKEHVAFHVHLANEKVDANDLQAVERARRRFVAFSCGAFPSELLESELFGYVPGAFTGAGKKGRTGLLLAARDGTVFLDEIGEMPPAQQVKLLRTIQERKVRPLGADEDKSLDARLVFATHRDLVAAVRDGAFREDLYYRIAQMTVVLPPLRARRDRVALAEALVARIVSAKSEFARGNKLEQSAKDFVWQYAWPGNVRQLENCLLRACVFAANKGISANDLKEGIPESENDDRRLLGLALPLSRPLKALHDELDRHYLKRAWEQSKGVRARAAELLDLGKGDAGRVTFSNRWKAAFKEAEYAEADASPKGGTKRVP